MKRLNLGCGRDIKKGWINLDILKLPGVDVVYDLTNYHCLLKIMNLIIFYAMIFWNMWNIFQL